MKSRMQGEAAKERRVVAMVGLQSPVAVVIAVIAAVIAAVLISVDRTFCLDSRHTKPPGWAPSRCPWKLLVLSEGNQLTCMLFVLQTCYTVTTKFTNVHYLLQVASPQFPKIAGALTSLG